ncbi:pre-16S rRNA-processing nuclease YqgF [Pelosinus sp. sgz500959]|uniref:pre-16S rRNA-processing nuclease YqgF n=1 Tax=Pelosinus sp. sgz500959 TaxID=3242472 RepID=UPI00366E6C3E
MMDEIIIAIDPGREKCGIAIVHKEKGILIKSVIQTDELTAKIEKFITEYSVSLIVIGDGTSSREAKQSLEKIKMNHQGLAIILIDERNSTDEARRRYWSENPPRGLKRLIPVTMQVPPRPVDDYVALILAERYFVKIL